MKIAIVVHGRFHAFDLAKALLQRNHDVRVLTNYPRAMARRFGLPEQCVDSFPLHAVLSRAAMTVGCCYPESSLHRLFGSWAARRLCRESWDCVHPFTGIAEESLLRLGTAAPVLLMRGSAHIRTQSELLLEEEQRTGISLDRPSRWMIEREEREYSAGARIITLSSFAYKSFLARGFPENRLAVLPLGVDVSAFRASDSVIEERCKRIQSGDPLRLLYAGNMSLQKGFYDFAEIVKRLPPDRFFIRCIGQIMPEARPIAHEIRERVEFIPKQPQRDLPGWYANSDAFVFPTIQDGFAVVLGQAQANGLPILTTTNCSGPDIVRDGLHGWVLSIRSPESFVDRLIWCEQHRSAIVEMVHYLHREFVPRSWADVAADFESLAAGPPS